MGPEHGIQVVIQLDLALNSRQRHLLIDVRHIKKKKKNISCLCEGSETWIIQPWILSTQKTERRHDYSKPRGASRILDHVFPVYESRCANSGCSRGNIVLNSFHLFASFK